MKAWEDVGAASRGRLNTYVIGAKDKDVGHHWPPDPARTLYLAEKAVSLVRIKKRDADCCVRPVCAAVGRGRRFGDACCTRRTEAGVTQGQMRERFPFPAFRNNVVVAAQRLDSWSVKSYACNCV